MLMNALSAKAVASLKEGKHRDGQGLQFEVKGGSRRWTFSYMFQGRQRELAIGKYPAMSLADARAKRAELRDAKDRGINPRTVLAGTAVPTAVTFRRDMDTFVAHMRGQWVPAHLREWQQSVDRIAGPLMDMATANLTQGDVLNVITPVWGTPTRRHAVSSAGSSKPSNTRWQSILDGSPVPTPATTSCGTCLACPRP
jgi:Arm DNA-binding domain